jgi:molybdate transport system substrate-binding protein
MLRNRSAGPLAGLLLAGALAAGGPRAAAADDVRVMTSGGLAAAYRALAPEFERTAGHRMVALATATGLGPASIPSRVRSGEAVDVVILPRAAIDELIAEGRIVAASRTDLATSRIGLAVRRGAPKPDIRSVEGLRRTLLQARSVALSAQVSGIYVSTELFPRLGIAEEMKRRSVRVESGLVGEAVARGEAEMGFQQISELLGVDGLEFVGPLPDEVQRITVFSAGVAATAMSPAAARAFIMFLTSPDGVRGMVKSGLDPLSPR